MRGARDRAPGGPVTARLFSALQFRAYLYLHLDGLIPNPREAEEGPLRARRPPTRSPSTAAKYALASHTAASSKHGNVVCALVKNFVVNLRQISRLFS